MKVIALISGGKDSTFNMIKCVEAGHEIIALVNLYPPAGCEELDSYMYQSVGHDAIELYAKCLGSIPLYRQEISGTPLALSLDYQKTDLDEVEDLYKVLKQVKESHPDAEGVSSGAIHSTYQKNRVEEVCARLGLTSLAYLWGREQSELLAEMISNGVEAILVKVAVYGLEASDLGSTLAQIKPKMDRLAAEVGVNQCGEGGEFESLTLDCPLFKTHKLKILDSEVRIHKESGTVQVAFMKIRSIDMIPK